MSQPNLQPILHGPLVMLRPLVEADWPDLFRAAADPEIWAGHTNTDRYQEPVFRTFFDEALATGSALSIVDKITGDVIGSSRYHDYRPDDSEIEIGWSFLTRSHWGRGYNAAFKRLMLTHAFTFADTVIFRVDPSNQISQKAMTKIGGDLRDGLFEKIENGVSQPYLIFEITKDRFAARPLNTDAT